LAWDVAWELTRRLPEAAAFALADACGRLACRLAPRTRRRLRSNLGRVVASGGSGRSLDELVADAFRSYARYWVEAFRAADLDPAELHRRTSTDGTVHLDAALEQGRGVVVLLAHHGSWDIAARWGEAHGYHLAVVAEVVRPRRVFEKFVRLRERVGLEVVPLRRGEGLVGRLGQVLTDNHLVGLLADRDLTGRAPVVELFGEQARVPAGAVLLSKRTGAAIVPATMLQRPGRRWHLQVLPPLDVQALSLEEGCSAAAGAIEQLVMLDPAQWHAFQPVWLADQSGRQPQPADDDPRSPP
ncbi:MAG TPA: phosphatidylinositol mannoside acyltransferase, partial [Egibacteraceae bacterium]|nr:phosphatidylinositol mannoside acyltransferase [Egibacteraceae bacterium]